jgi:hypothetical protein
MTKMSSTANRRVWIVLFVLANVFLLLRSEEDRRTMLFIDAGAVGVFLIALLATRIWPDKIWLRRNDPSSKG